MSASAWITSILVAVILYGGFAWCVSVAVKKGREEHDRAGHGPSDPK
jgi:hypothetical protein